MSDVIKRFRREPSAMAGLTIALVIVIAAILGPFIWPPSPIEIHRSLLGTPLPPSFAHPFGTDILGRDELARALVGARISLSVGITAMLIAVSFGTLYGAISGAFGGAVDAVMMRVVDAMLSFPTFFLIITVEALTGKFSLYIIVLVIGLLSWMGVARLVRAEVLSLRERDFVEAANAIGASQWRIVTKYLIPNAMAPVIVAATLAIGDNILVEAGLSYLGLGVQVPTPSWGNMLQDALLPAVRSAWWLVMTPGLLIVITMLAFSLVGEGMRIAVDRSIAQDGEAPAEVDDVDPGIATPLRAAAG